MWRSVGSILAGLTVACSASVDQELATFGQPTAGAPTPPGSRDTDDPGEDPSTGGDSSDSLDTGGSDSADPPDPEVYFDVGTQPDGGGGTNVPIIPVHCNQAAAAETTVGCQFFAVDLDQAGGIGSGTETDQYAVGISNVQNAQSAQVTVERKTNGAWHTIAGPVTIEPLSLHTFELPDLHQDGSGVLSGGAYRLTSDVPVIAYQFSPLVAATASSDASMLYPVTSWDTIGHVVQWPTGVGESYVTIAAAFDGTQVQVTPSVPTAAGPGVSSGSPANPITLELDEGDVAEIMVAGGGLDISGTVVTSNAGHPIAVFAGHECANIPNAIIACDHVEEQLSGLRLWGTTFLASRVPPRQDPPEPAAWQIYASEDDTVVEITAPPGVTGLPVTPVVLQRGEKLEFLAGGNTHEPGDFLVQTSRPAAVINYVTGWGNLEGSTQGDPAMVQLSPVEQFLPRYVVLVPSEWPEDYLVLTRPEGSSITLDDELVPDDAFIPAASGYEVARVPVNDGVHSLDGTDPFSVVVVGYGLANSYAYLGGASTGQINPNPAG